MPTDAISLSRLLYVGLAAIVAVIAWFIFRTGDPIAADRDSSGNPIVPRQRTRRDELIEARAHVRRQIEILKSPIRGGSQLIPGNNGEASRRTGRD